MKIYIYNLCLIFLFNIHLCYAQPSATIKGRVLENKTNAPVSNTEVVILDKSIGDVCDENGVFLINNLKADTYTITAYRIGYDSVMVADIHLRPGEVRELTIYLKPVLIKLNSVRVDAERLWEKHLTEASVVGIERLQARELMTIPGMMDDPIRAVQVFSGVVGLGDYSGELAVRGASPSQNQVVMDGVIIPNPYRFRLAFGGGLSAINPHTLQDIYLHLGGFSAEYGNALSSVLEVATRDGDRNRYHSQANLNITDMGAIVEGPLFNKKGSFIFSTRRTYYDLIVNRFAKSNAAAYPNFYEFSGKVQFVFSESNRLTLHLSRSGEGADLTKEFADDVGVKERAVTKIASLNWRKLISDKWQFDTSVSIYDDDTEYRAFQFDSIRVYDYELNKLDTVVRETDYESVNMQEINLTVKERIQLKTGDKSWLNWGASFTRIPSEMLFKSVDKGLLYGRLETPGSVGFDSGYFYTATYLESTTEANPNLHLRIGLRYDYSSLIGEGEFSPRFNIWYRLNDATTLEGGWGYFYQYPNPLTIYSRDVPVDLSRGLNQLSAEKATHHLFTVTRTFGETYRAKVQLYDKQLERLLLPVEEDSYEAGNLGTGYARGFEVILEKKRTRNLRHSGIISYALGKAEYRSIYDESDDFTRFKYDRRHAVTALYNFRFRRNWNFSFFGQYASGMPFTDIKYISYTKPRPGGPAWAFVRDEHMAAKFPAFKKLDIRLSYLLQSQSSGIEFYLDLINVTNQKNIVEMTWERGVLLNGQNEAVRREIYMLPRIASFGVGFKL